jgi:hypothetical protein
MVSFSDFFSETVTPHEHTSQQKRKHLQMNLQMMKREKRGKRGIENTCK